MQIDRVLAALDVHIFVLTTKDLAVSTHSRPRCFCQRCSCATRVDVRDALTSS